MSDKSAKIEFKESEKKTVVNIIGRSWLFLGFSGTLVAASLFAIALFGFRQGIDFVGGTLWQIRARDSVLDDKVLREFFNSKAAGETIITLEEKSRSFIIRTKAISEEERKEWFNELANKYKDVEELGFQSIGPVIGSELRRKSMIAVGLVLLGISLFVAVAFRKVSRPISSWKYGIVTLLTLFHDVVIPAGLFAYLGYAKGIEIDTNFIVALLVVMGFSVHDTIVVFDRIRENLLLSKQNEELSAVVNRSVNETLARSINTSLTLVLVLIAMLFFGPPTLSYFIFTILVGVVFGTYSSIFVASPLLVIWHTLSRRLALRRSAREG